MCIFGPSCLAVERFKIHPQCHLLLKESQPVKLIESLQYSFSQNPNFKWPKIAVFWDVAPFSLVETDSRFRGAYCFHHQGNRPDYGGDEDSYLHTRRRDNLKSHLQVANLQIGKLKE
jgi:hypothetical protein